MDHADQGDEHLVHAYVDGELDVATSLTVERRIDSDPALQRLALEIGILKKALAEKFPPEPVSPDLLRRIKSTVLARRNQWVPRWALAAASVLIAVALTGVLMLTHMRNPGLPGSATELVDAHLRALMAVQPFDVASSEQHTVKPWFNGRITQSPRVIDLHEHGFDLAGGRIDVVNNMPVPTLVYRRRQHVISVTEASVNESSPGSFTAQAKNGFNVIGWSDGVRSFVAISDLNAAELKYFTELFRAAS